MSPDPIGHPAFAPPHAAEQQPPRPDESSAGSDGNPASQQSSAHRALTAEDAALSAATGQGSAPAAAASAATDGAEAQGQDAKTKAQREAERRAEQERRERQAFEQAAQQIKEAVRADSALAELAPQLAIDMTPEGLRIQIMDEERRPMFATGSAAPNDRARLLLAKVTPVLLKLSEDISIAGHTDATPYAGQQRTNWELSADRANATRRLLVEAGLPQSRIRNVTGNADRDPLLPADPAAAANRRIAIVVLRAHGAQAIPAVSTPR